MTSTVPGSRKTERDDSEASPDGREKSKLRTATDSATTNRTGSRRARDTLRPGEFGTAQRRCAEIDSTN